MLDLLMYKFSNSSNNKLSTCHPLLQLLFNRVVEYYDCTVIDGTRDKKTQDYYCLIGKSKVRYPNSKHNSNPSMAVDVAPYIKGKGIVWNKEQCYYFAGYVLGIARILDIKIRWGGDWSMDNDIHDQSFNDLVHFELIGD